MPFSCSHIRPIVVAIIRRGEEILAMQCFDKVKEQHFYRPLGGGIEFGETASDALKREFMEELGLEIIVGTQLAVCENIFTFGGKQGHEIVFVYSAEFADKAIYSQDKISFIEKGLELDNVGWVNLACGTIIYPEIIRLLLAR